MTDVENPIADHVLANRVSWDEDADNWAARGRILWAANEISWASGACLSPS